MRYYLTYVLILLCKELLGRLEDVGGRPVKSVDGSSQVSLCMCVFFRLIPRTTGDIHYKYNEYVCAVMPRLKYKETFVYLIWRT